MSDITIPLDMINQEASRKCGGTVVSIRDMLIALGLSDERLREFDRVRQLHDEILTAEPWRDRRRWKVLGKQGDGEIGVWEGEIDWSGTEMEAIEQARLAEQRSRPMTIGQIVDGHTVWLVHEWDGSAWVAVRHAECCECPECK